MVSTFIDEVVQESGEPYSDSEVTRINSRHGFSQPFAPIPPES